MEMLKLKRISVALAISKGPQSTGITEGKAALDAGDFSGEPSFRKIIKLSSALAPENVSLIPTKKVTASNAGSKNVLPMG